MVAPHCGCYGRSLTTRWRLLQPPHFIAEVAAVLARESPATAGASLNDLLDLEMQIVESAGMHARAVALATRHNHHLSDTL